jgi:1-acyl-sn-glycerol-3-phosphate acyltransferase
MTPIGHLRAWTRLLMLVLVTGTFASYAAIVTAFGMDDVERLRRRGTLFRGWCRAVLKVAGIRLRVRGRCPDAASLVIANHLSYLDVMVLGAETPMVFVAKSEVASWPVIGPLCAFVGTLFIDRSSRAGLPALTTTMANLMAAGIRVMVFPEGTTTSGDQVLPFRPALLQPAVDRGAAVVCATLLYETPPGSVPAQSSVCWVGDAPFAPHVYGFLGLPSIDAHVVWSDAVMKENNRRGLAARAHAAITTELEALRERKAVQGAGACDTVVPCP